MLCLLFFIFQIAKSETIYSSGFYEEDSIYFTVNWETDSGQEIRIAINNFTNEGFEKYSGGVWLKRRNPENTWEDKLYTLYDCEYPSDPSQPIGSREKVNVVRVGLFDAKANRLIKDSVYVIGLAQSIRPYYNFFITVDSAEFDNMMTHYDDDIRIRAWLTLFSDKGDIETNQPVEFYIAAGSSACIANKGFMVKGSDKPPILNKKGIRTSIFSNDQNLIHEKRIKLRSGNGGHGSKFGVNEVVQQILDYPSLKVGGVKNNVGVIYINGSYWSLTFPQKKFDDERDIALKIGVDKDSIDVLSLFSFEGPIDTIYRDCEKPDHCGYFVKFDFESDSNASYIYKDFFSFDTLQFLSDDDTRIPGIHNLLIVKDIGKNKIVGAAMEGSEIRFQQVAQTLVDLRHINDTNLVTQTLEEVIDIDNWLRYIIVCNYFHLHDIVFNNVIAVQTHNDKPFLVSSDYDYFHFQDGVNCNNWDTKIVHDTEYFLNDIGFLRQSIRLILSQPKLQKRMVQLYQDMTNTVFESKRLLSILDNFKNKFIEEYPNHHQAWGGYPNGGQTEKELEEMYASLRNFLLYRNEHAIQILTDRWQSNYSLNVEKDWHTITFVLDSIAENSVEIIINDDVITSFKNNWSGKYLKYPEVSIDIIDLSGQGEVYIKEFPYKGLNFSLNPQSDLNITLMRR